jgi:hypothetical protein
MRIKDMLYDFRPDEDGISAEGTPPERPEWLPQQFSKPEDLVKSYEESRAEMSRAQNELRAQQQQFSEALETMVQEQQRTQQTRVDPNTDPLLVAYDEAVQQGDARAQLAIQMQLNQQMLRNELQSRDQTLTPRIEAQAAQQRQIQVDMAETQVRAEAIAGGLDYDASRDDVIGALRVLYGETLLPVEGDTTTYAAAIRNAVQIVKAQAILEQQTTSEQQRREKLSLGTMPQGAPGRTATGSKDEQQEWAAIKDAPTGTYSEMMAKGR